MVTTRNVERARQSDLEGLVIRWRDAGKPDKSIKPVLDALERHSAIARDARVAEQAADGSLEAVAIEIAEGRLTYDEGLSEVDRRSLPRQSIPASRYRIGTALREAAQGECLRVARDFLRLNAQKLAAEGGPSFVGWLQRYADPDVS